jgi:hypothetical protein
MNHIRALEQCYSNCTEYIIRERASIGMHHDGINHANGMKELRMSEHIFDSTFIESF